MVFYILGASKKGSITARVWLALYHDHTSQQTLFAYLEKQHVVVALNCRCYLPTLLKKQKKYH